MDDRPTLSMRDVLGSGELDEVLGRAQYPTRHRKHRAEDGAVQTFDVFPEHESITDQVLQEREYRVDQTVSLESVNQPFVQNYEDADHPESSCVHQVDERLSRQHSHSTFGDPEPQSDGRRVSRPRELVRRLRQRAASFRNEHFKDRGNSEPTSRRPSIPDPALATSTTPLGYSHDSSTSSDHSRSSPGTSPEVSFSALRYSATKSSLPASPPSLELHLPPEALTSSADRMPGPRSSAFLDPAAINRHQQLTAQKARTTKIALDEEALIRGRLRRKGLEHTFPHYRFVDFIGRGTYGRVFHAWVVLLSSLLRVRREHR